MNELTEVAREVSTAYEGFGTNLFYFLVGGVVLGLIVLALRSGRGKK